MFLFNSVLLFGAFYFLTLYFRGFIVSRFLFLKNLFEYFKLQYTSISNVEAEEAQ